MHLKSQTRIYNVLKNKEKKGDCSRISIITSRGQHEWVEISENCFHKHFVLMGVVLKDKGIP